MLKPFVPLFFCLFYLASNAQGIIQEKNNLLEGITTNSQQANFLNQQTQISTLDLTVSNNGVLIEQIGDNNNINLQTKAQSTGIQIAQLGNLNEANLNLSADRIDYSLIQNGNRNTLLELNNNANTELLQRSIEQTGNGQNLIIHGQNSIIDKMKITMTGSQSVIIRNSN